MRAFLSTLLVLLVVAVITAATPDSLKRKGMSDFSGYVFNDTDDYWYPPAGDSSGNKFSRVRNDYFVDLARSELSGEEFFTLRGYDNSVSDEVQTAWTLGQTMTMQSAACSLEIYCADAADDKTGIGAKTVEITLLDSTYTERTVYCNTDGNTTVEVGTYKALRVNQAKVYAAGSVGTNSGEVWICKHRGTTYTSGKPVSAEVALCVIPAGRGVSHAGVYTVPYGKQAYISGWKADVAATTSTTVHLRIQEYGAPYYYTRTHRISAYGGLFDLSFKGVVIPAKADIMIVATSGQTLALESQVDLILSDE
jgi:hypothetical protein